MNPLSIILVFVFMGVLVLSGMVAVSFGSQRLYRLVQSRVTSGVKVSDTSLSVLAVVAGLLVTSYGAFVIFRIVWGT